MQNNQFGGTYYQPPQNNNGYGFDEDLNKSLLHRSKEKKEIRKTGWVLGMAIVACVALQVVTVLLLKAIGLQDLYDKSVIFQHSFTMIGVHFISILLPFGVASIILKKQYVTPSIPTKKVKGSTAALWVITGLGACILANYLTAFVVALFNQFGYELTQSELIDPKSPIEYLFMIFSTAIVPGIIEELSMRGFALGALRKYGKGFAVVAVSIVFGLLHGNVIQFVFAFAVGLVLGYVTVRTDNISIAIIIHAINNSLSVIQTITKNELGDKWNNYITLIIMGAFFVLGIIGLVSLIVKKELLPPKAVKSFDPYALTTGEKFQALVPGFIIPFLMLIVLSATTIHKI